MTSTRAVHSAVVGRDAFAVLPPAKPALRAASRSEVQDIALRCESGTVKTVPYRSVGAALRGRPSSVCTTARVIASLGQPRQALSRRDVGIAPYGGAVLNVLACVARRGRPHRAAPTVAVLSGLWLRL